MAASGAEPGLPTGTLTVVGKKKNALPQRVDIFNIRRYPVFVKSMQ